MRIVVNFDYEISYGTNNQWTHRSLGPHFEQN